MLEVVALCLEVADLRDERGVLIVELLHLRGDGDRLLELGPEEGVLLAEFFQLGVRRWAPGWRLALA